MYFFSTNEFRLQSTELKASVKKCEYCTTWLGFLPTVFPNTCSLTSPMMSFATWLGSDFVFTLFAMRQLLGITGLP